MSGEPTRQVRFGKCDECGRVLYFGDKAVHTEMGDYFCSWDCWYKRRDDIWANEGKKVPIRYKGEILK